MIKLYELLMLPAPPVGGRGIVFPDCPSVRPSLCCKLTLILCDANHAIYLYSVEGLYRNLSRKFIMCAVTAEKAFKVGDQGHIMFCLFPFSLSKVADHFMHQRSACC